MLHYHNEDIHPTDAAELMLEKVDLQYLAEVYQTPLFVYSKNSIVNAYTEYAQALSKQQLQGSICYAVKANSNLAILQLLANCGAGFDIVSGGELKRLQAINCDLTQVVFSGVGKTYREIEAALQANIRCFNVESEAELLRIDAVAKRIGKKAPISLRVNPDVDAKTHPYIATGLHDNKFGIASLDALEIYQRAKQLQHISIVGIDCHIGSQITQVEPFVEALQHVLQLVTKLEEKDIYLQHIDMGGGLGIAYNDEQPPPIDDFIQALATIFNRFKQQQPRREQLQLILEPGRSIIGKAGVLLTRIEHLKFSSKKNFAIVDAAMNDLLRPALYNAKQQILPLQQRAHDGAKVYDVVGPVCETGDFLGKNRQLNIEEGDYLAVLDCGAYGFCMSSNYNSRPLAAEVLVDGKQHYLINQRQQFAQMIANEQLPTATALKPKLQTR